MKKYSYVVTNPRTRMVKQFITNHDYYRVGDLVTIDGESWKVLSRNF